MRRWAVSTTSHYFNQIQRLFQEEFGRLILFFVGAIALTLILADHNAVADTLFQSPASPPAQPTQEPPPPTPSPSADQAPAQPTPAQPPPTQPPPAQQQPPQQPAPAPDSQFVSPVESAVPGSSPPALPAGNEPPPLAQPSPQPRPVRVDQENSLLDAEEGSSNFILDQVEFVDTIVVSGAYIWLCCGAILFLLIPLFFLFLQIRGQIKIQREEDL